MEKKVELFAQEILMLKEQCATATNFIKDHKCDTQKSLKLIDENENDNVCDVDKEKVPIAPNLNEEFSKLENILSSDQLGIMNDLKVRIQLYVDQKILESKANRQDEMKQLKEQLENEKNDYDTEITRLQQLLLGVKCGSTELLNLKQELETKHAKEVEELRTYFEQKCSDMEKKFVFYIPHWLRVIYR